jgi:hypothetical protein
VIASRGGQHGSGLGRWRWVVERAFARLQNFGRPRVRWERDPFIRIAFPNLECAAICWRHLAE